MSARQASSPLHQQTADTMPSEPKHLEITVKSLTAKVFLNHPVQDLLPVRYLRKAKQIREPPPNRPSNSSARTQVPPDSTCTNNPPHIATVQRKAWIFRNGNEDGREVDLSEWSQIDIRYRGVFKTLLKCPKFALGLWDGAESCQRALERGKPKAQGQVVYALLNEIGRMIGVERETNDGEGVFVLAYVAARRCGDCTDSISLRLVPASLRPRLSTGLDIVRSTEMDLGPLASCPSSTSLTMFHPS